MLLLRCDHQFLNTRILIFYWRIIEESWFPIAESWFLYKTAPPLAAARRKPSARPSLAPIMMMTSSFQLSKSSFHWYTIIISSIKTIISLLYNRSSMYITHHIRRCCMIVVDHFSRVVEKSATVCGFSSINHHYLTETQHCLSINYHYLIETHRFSR